MPQLEIEISPAGEVKIDAVGFTGSACQVATLPFEQALGSVQHTEDKPELAQVAHEQQLKQGY